MYRPEPQTRRGPSRPGPGSSQEPGPSRDPWLRQRQVLHDAANWLTVLLGHVEALRDAPGDRDFARHLELARRAARAAHRLCALPPDPGRPGSGIDALRHARRLLDHLGRTAADRGISLELLAEAPSVEVTADAAGFDDALLNLLRNGIEATPSGGRVRLRIGSPAAGFVEIRVEDGGPGVSPALRTRIGRPGNSTKAGTDRGLGLSRVQNWLAASGTALEVGEAPTGGASIGFVLPSAPAPETGVATERPGGRRVLLVEDDLAVAEVLSLLLQADGHRVRHESDLHGARAGFEPGRYDLVLCDQNLPDGSGSELLQTLGVADANLACFLVTGDPESVHSPPAHLSGVLAKPVSRDDLRRAVASSAGAELDSDPARSDDA